MVRVTGASPKGCLCPGITCITSNSILYYHQNTDPKYEFGFGLSYTQFNYSNINVQKLTDKFDVTVTVENTGELDGAEIPQLYLEFPAEADQPSKVRIQTN